MLNLNRKVGSLTLVARSVLGAQLALGTVLNENMADGAVDFAKVNASFASATLATQKRVVYPLLTGAAVALPAANSMDVTTDMGPTAASIAAPVFNATTRTWSNLGAITYTPENKVFLRAPGASNAPDGSNPILDASGDEVYGRLTFAASVFTLSFFVAPGGVETAYAFTASTNALVFYRQWVDGSSTLLEDTGKSIFNAPGAVDITETNNINQLAGEIGVTLGNNGALTLPLGRSVVLWAQDHLNGTTGERHTTDQVDASAAAKLAVSGAGSAATLDNLLAQLQTNITASGTSATTSATTALQTYFNELRSPGVLGTAATLVADTTVANQADVPARTAYVAGVRYLYAATTVAVASSTSVAVWVDNTGAVKSGAAYPTTGDFAKLGTATASSTGVVSISDDHRALIQLDQKVLDVEAALTSHVASTTAHAGASITASNANLTDAFGVTMVNPDASAITNVQQAIDATVARLNAAKKGVKAVILTQSGNAASGVEGDISTATADTTVSATAEYLTFVLPVGQQYSTGKNLLEVIIDGDDQDLLNTSVAGSPTGVYFEQDATHVRVYFDSTTPLQAGMKVKLRWPTL